MKAVVFEIIRDRAVVDQAPESALCAAEKDRKDTAAIRVVLIKK